MPLVRWLKPIAVCFVLLFGCDSFSLVEQFQTPASTAESQTSTPPLTAPPLIIALQSPTVNQNAATLVFPSGGTQPYSFGVLADNLAYTGTMGTVTATPYQYTAGTSIGTIKIRVTDNTGNTADTIVTVRPLPPENFSVNFTTSPPRANLSWTYPNTTHISGYEIWSSTDSGVSYTLLTSPILGSSVLAYIDNGTSGEYYRIYAVSGSFQSVPVDVN